MSSNSSTDDGVLTPDDLRLDDDRVDELGENRYLVRSDRSAPAGGSAPSDILPAVEMSASASANTNTNASANTNTNASANTNTDDGKTADATTSSSDSAVNPFDFPLADPNTDADHGLESVPESGESDTASGVGESEPTSDTITEPRGPGTSAEPRGPDSPESHSLDSSSNTSDTHPLESTSDPHGIDVTLKTDGELAHLQTTSKDVREVFAEMLTWYADQLDDDLSPAQVLEVMLATTDLEA
ncbi:hypothetical protein OB955_16375 [Halobacteria archaeon AArc-m2/3/4]|uniref:Uncharacterized protein n=1 Tax=Natronoglomus mannanivorans TaxID=2979990 RepID=A0ABT2QH88_9EURY|nr:hypothetical protein [Halobacteria archaeon AArc-m2/3/4]